LLRIRNVVEALLLGGLNGREEVGGGLSESVSSDSVGERRVGAERRSEGTSFGDAFVGGSGRVEGSRSRFLREEGFLPVCSRRVSLT
jgi:hypothetical protein